ncbi:transmembrane protein [Cystoisospora suis]|uniref:Transmembrane protein n=1 Tax=Cystoisospora suis TaxID=483139 RepID=A0A2C6LBR7_9APIC|nr:transmembrane protein [Cystoisospora suis]
MCTAKKADRRRGRVVVSALFGVALCSAFSRQSADVSHEVESVDKMVSSFTVGIRFAAAEERQLQRRSSVFSFLGRGDTKNVEAVHETFTDPTTPVKPSPVTESTQDVVSSSIPEATADSSTEREQEVADQQRAEQGVELTNEIKKEAAEQNSESADEARSNAGNEAAGSKQGDSSEESANQNLQTEAGQLSNTRAPDATQLNSTPTDNNGETHSQTSEPDNTVQKDSEAGHAGQPTVEGERENTESQDEVDEQSQFPVIQQENPGALQGDAGETALTYAPHSAITFPQAGQEPASEAAEPPQDVGGHQTIPQPADRLLEGEDASTDIADAGSATPGDRPPNSEGDVAAGIDAAGSEKANHESDTETGHGTVLSDDEAIKEEITWEIMPETDGTHQDDESEQPDVEVISLDLSTGISPHLEPIDNLSSQSEQSVSVLSATVTDEGDFPSPREAAELPQNAGISAVEEEDASGLAKDDSVFTQTVIDRLEPEEESDTNTLVTDGTYSQANAVPHSQSLRSRVDANTDTSRSEPADDYLAEQETNEADAVAHNTEAKTPEQAQPTLPGGQQRSQLQNSDAYGMNISSLFPWIPARDVLSLVTAARILELRPLLELSGLNGSGSRSASSSSPTEQHDDASRMQQQLQHAAVLAEDYIKKYLPNGSDARSRFQKAWRTLPFHESFHYLPDSEDDADIYSEEIDFDDRLEDEELDALVKRIRTRLMKLAAFNQTTTFLPSAMAADSSIPSAVTAFLNSSSSAGGTFPSAVNSFLTSSFLRQFV